jgi:acyl-CoA thioester hydrolase
MNLAYYVLAFDLATDAFFDEFGLNQAYRDRTGCSTFSGEIHVFYKRELHEGDAFTVTSTLLGFDEKRIRYMNQMYRADDGSDVALVEAISLHVDLTKRRVCRMNEPLPTGLARIQASQGTIVVPPEIGRTIAKPPIYVGR